MSHDVPPAPATTADQRQHRVPASAAEVAMLFEVHPLVIQHMVGRWVGGQVGGWAGGWGGGGGGGGLVGGPKPASFKLARPAGSCCSPSLTSPPSLRTACTARLYCLQPAAAVHRHRDHRQAQHLLRKVHHALPGGWLAAALLCWRGQGLDVDDSLLPGRGQWRAAVGACFLMPPPMARS